MVLLNPAFLVLIFLSDAVFEMYTGPWSTWIQGAGNQDLHAPDSTLEATTASSSHGRQLQSFEGGPDVGGGTPSFSDVFKQPETREELEQQLRSSLLHNIFQLVVTICIEVGIAYAYLSSVTSKRPMWPAEVQPPWNLAQNQHKHGLFDCFDDFEYCLYGCCCHAVRIADNFEATKSAPYWNIVGAFIAMLVAGAIVPFVWFEIVMQAGLPLQYLELGRIFILMMSAGLAFFLAKQRQILRMRLGDAKGDKMGEDFLLMFCCSCCVSIQDARQVDGATGVRVSCCCRLDNLTGQSVVGQPLMNTHP